MAIIIVGCSSLFVVVVLMMIISVNVSVNVNVSVYADWSSYKQWGVVIVIAHVTIIISNAVNVIDVDITTVDHE